MSPSPDERRVGKRALQKRTWDRENQRDTCPTCGGMKWKTSRRCMGCRRPSNPPQF